MRWLVLAFIPSSLLLGVTTYITTDIAAVPLLWVVPLALYLLTFILVFAARPPIPHRPCMFSRPRLLAWHVPARRAATRSGWSSPLHLPAFFVAAMVCHGELALAPAAGAADRFLSDVSLGGVLGGAFNALCRRCCSSTARSNTRSRSRSRALV